MILAMVEFAILAHSSLARAKSSRLGI